MELIKEIMAFLVLFIMRLINVIMAFLVLSIIGAMVGIMMFHLAMAFFIAFFPVWALFLTVNPLFNLPFETKVLVPVIAAVLGIIFKLTNPPGVVSNLADFFEDIQNILIYYLFVFPCKCAIAIYNLFATERLTTLQFSSAPVFRDFYAIYRSPPLGYRSPSPVHRDPTFPRFNPNPPPFHFPIHPEHHLNVNRNVNYSFQRITPQPVISPRPEAQTVNSFAARLEKIGYDHTKIPEEFVCAISFEIMEHPYAVTTVAPVHVHNFEKASIDNHLRMVNSVPGRNNTNPYGQKIQHCRSNSALKDKIEKFVADQEARYQGDLNKKLNNTRIQA